MNSKKKSGSGFAITNFIREESLGGFILIFVTIIALIWANSPFADLYHYIWYEVYISFEVGNYSISANGHHWINDGLMALFFFTIGLEIKREVMAGELSSLKKASLPIFAAIGGMLIPAMIYVIINFNNPEYLNGWGISMATDIAFALGLLSLLGKRVNINLKIFLTALAIADDLGAIMVIAIFYTEQIDIWELINAAFFVLVLLGANKLGVRRATFYALVGLGGVWLSFLYSGVHATIAGVIIAMTIPVKPKINESTYIDKLTRLLDKFKKEKGNDSDLLTKQQSNLVVEIEKTTDEVHTPLQSLEHSLHPVTSYIILPLFALANAGVSLKGDLGEIVLSPVALGIILGLLVGKTFGIYLISRMAVWLKLASLPEGVSWKQIFGAAAMAGIGFTMSIFIAELAFEGTDLIRTAKIGILTASIIAATVGMTILSRSSKP